MCSPLFLSLSFFSVCVCIVNITRSHTSPVVWIILHTVSFQKFHKFLFVCSLKILLICKFSGLPQSSTTSCFLLELSRCPPGLSSPPIPNDGALLAVNDIAHTKLLHGEKLTCWTRAKSSVRNHVFQTFIVLLFFSLDCLGSSAYFT